MFHSSNSCCPSHLIDLAMNCVFEVLTKSGGNVVLKRKEDKDRKKATVHRERLV